MKVTTFLEKRKYELLLFALIQHLYIGIFLTDLTFYMKVIWPVNMLVLGFASIGVFVQKGRMKNIIRNILFLVVFLLPVSISFSGHATGFMQILSLIYVVFFAFIFYEVFRFLLKPSYINADIFSASACGYFLLLEMSVFFMQFLFYIDPASIKNMNTFNPATVYIDLVYFCSIIQTTIGFGDITPNAHYTKLTASFFGVIGQFYSVVLVGILISKFTSAVHK